MIEENCIEVQGARVHNLKNIDVKIPRDELVVITAIGQWKIFPSLRYHLCRGTTSLHGNLFGLYSSFLGNMERPEVDKIDGLSPVIAIEQKTTSKVLALPWGPLQNYTTSSA